MSRSTKVLPWQVAGTYFEACNCEAVCPCRSQGGRAGGRSTYGICDFALSWSILGGRAAGVALAGLTVVMGGSYNDDEPGSPWRVALYIDDRADEFQHYALSQIFLGRAGGTTFQNYARAIGEVYAVRTANIDLDHTADRQHILADEYVLVRGVEPVHSNETISCGIPGHDHPGREVITEQQRIEDPPLRWEVRGRCGFATDFSYASDEEDS